jgi:hypothetical protein
MHRGSSSVTPSVASATQGYFSSPNGLRIPGEAVHRPGAEGEARARQDDHRSREPGKGMPPSRRKPSVGEQQDHVDAQQPHSGYPHPLPQGADRRREGGPSWASPAGHTSRSRCSSWRASRECRRPGRASLWGCWGASKRSGLPPGGRRGRATLGRALRCRPPRTPVTRRLHGSGSDVQHDARSAQEERETGERPGEPSGSAAIHPADSSIPFS